MRKKIVAKSELRSFANRLHRSAKRIVFSNGVFDILHAGHVNYLKRAKQLGDILVVGLNTDASARKNKGERRPINPYRYRAQVLAGLEAVDYVVPLERKTPDLLIRLIRPDVLVKGAEYREKEIVGAEFVKKYGGKVVRMKMVKGLSTSRIIEKIRKL